ncbi:MAG: glycosyltransferase [Bryobacterales bacterium]|nr:glycosyltransferase [Bryobacterales bacterium]
MRILYFSPRECWPANSGARLRDYHLVRCLAQHADVTYLGFATGEGRDGGSVWRETLGHTGVETVLVRRGASYSAADLARGLLGPLPVTVRNYLSPLMRQELTSLLIRRQFDLVQVEGVHLFPYIEAILASRPHSGKRPLLICDWHNIESELMRRYRESPSTSLPKRCYAMRTETLLRRLEDRLLRVCDGHVVCSGREKELLAARSNGARIHVTGNGVDNAYYRGAAAPPDAADLLYVGSMDYHANIDAVLYFAAEVWPLVRTRHAGLRFVIAGSRPTPEVRRLANLPGITVTGTVEDVRPYYHKALAMVAPLRIGGGTRLKILEAMAAGVPVVSTSLGAEGLNLEPETDFLPADSPGEMARQVMRLVSSAELRLLLTAAGRRAAAAYDWQVLGGELYRFYQTLPAASIQ